MSMLTPPGMGREYRITGSKYPRMRRRRRRGRIGLAAVASAAALGLLGWGTMQLVDVFSGGGDTAQASSAPCHDTGSRGHDARTGRAGSDAAARKLPEPRTIKVNILNATTRSGLAQKTADELKKRGFAIGKVGNATPQYDKKVKGSAVVLGPKAGSATSLPVLGAQIAGAEQRTDARKNTEVDLIIGDKFRALDTEPTAERALQALSQPKPSPSEKSSCQ